jgi:alanyl-tRNA synthetase
LKENRIFWGYDQVENEVKITRIRKVDSKEGVSTKFDATLFIQKEKTGDKGTLVSANETIEIIDTKKENNLILHFAKQPRKRKCRFHR